MLEKVKGKLKFAILAACMAVLALIPSAMATHTIIGGTGTVVNAGGATAAGEVLQPIAIHSGSTMMPSSLASRQ